MPTLNQLVKQKFRLRKKTTNNVFALKACPQKKAVIIKVREAKPKKPNSARRKVAKVKLALSRRVVAYIPGQGHTLKAYSGVLVSGGRANDLPGVRFSMMRGKFDLSWREDFERTNKRSKYGRPKNKA
jgi:small subunit ribosomal protein S12